MSYIGLKFNGKNGKKTCQLVKDSVMQEILSY